jgi:hypothetical protein
MTFTIADDYDPDGGHVGQRAPVTAIPDVLERCPGRHGRRHGAYLGRFQNLHRRIAEA